MLDLYELRTTPRSQSLIKLGYDSPEKILTLFLFSNIFNSSKNYNNSNHYEYEFVDFLYILA